MTSRQMYDFATAQVEWYEKQIQFCKEQIEFCNKELKRTRKEDKEIKAYALASDSHPLTQKIYGGNYIGTETRKYINERARWYRDVKHNEKRKAYYEKEAQEYAKYIG